MLCINTGYEEYETLMAVGLNKVALFRVKYCHTLPRHASRVSCWVFCIDATVVGSVYIYAKLSSLCVQLADVDALKLIGRCGRDEK